MLEGLISDTRRALRTARVPGQAHRRCCESHLAANTRPEQPHDTKCQNLASGQPALLSCPCSSIMTLLTTSNWPQLHCLTSVVISFQNTPAVHLAINHFPPPRCHFVCCCCSRPLPHLQKHNQPMNAIAFQPHHFNQLPSCQLVTSLP